MEITKYPDDMSVEDKQILSDYLREGCPSLGLIKDSDIFQWFQLYMTGKSYTEISKITNRKKELILYIANKMEWHEKRMAHYSEIAVNLLSKVTQTKLESANTLTTMVNSLNKYYGDKFDKYLATNDKTIIEDLDTKRLAQYHKAVESLEKLISNSMDKNSDNPTSPVNINITGNATIKQGEEDAVDVKVDDTFTDEDAANALKFLAKIQRQRKK